MKNLILILALSVSAPLFAEAIPGQVMLDYFSATCPSEGEWTQAALGDSRNLISVIEAISKDDDCKTLVGALGQLSSLNVQVEALAQQSETKKKIAEYDSQERELLIQLSKSTSQVDRDSMNFSLRNIQVSRAGLLGRENASHDLSGPDSVLALSRAAQLADASFKQIASNQKCVLGSPRILTTATGLVSSIGAAITAVNPALGLGLQAGSSFMGSAIESFRTNRFNLQIRDIAEGSTSYTGYKCALETMTNRWCDMVDSLAFIKYKTELRHSDVSEDLSTAIKLNDIEIPVALDWLLKVKSGVDPQNTADGQRQNTARRRKTYLEVLETDGKSTINNSRFEYSQVETDPKERFRLIRQIVNVLAPAKNDFDRSDIKNPFFDIYPQGYLPFYLLGVDDSDASIQANGRYVTLDDWKNPNGISPTLEDVRKKYDELVAQTRVKVERELTQVLRPDAGFTLTTAYDVPNDEYKLSPMDALKHLISFLEKNPPGADERWLLRIHLSTIEKLRVIYTAVEDVVLTDSLTIGSGKEQEALEIILNAADLTYGTVVIQARLEFLTRVAVLKLLKQSPREQQIIVAQLLASDRFMDTLKRYSGKDDPGAIEDDIYQAMGITKNNLNNFVKVFGKMISKQLKRLWEEERIALPTSATSPHKKREQLCHLLLGAEQASSYVDLRYCEGLKLGPQREGAPVTIALTKSSYQSDLGVRGCTLQDYNRSRKIYNQWLGAQKAFSVRRNLK